MHSRPRLHRQLRPLGQATRLGVVALTVAVATLCLPARANRYSPESPEVQAMVDRALAFLEKQGLEDPRLGAEALAGLAFLKARNDPSHPVVQGAVEQIRKRLPLGPDDLNQSEMVYSLSAAIIFLCELDPAAYRREIQELFAGLRTLQKPIGGWGYPAGHLHERTGDTSMSQFAVLAMWEAARAGFPVPAAMINGVTIWFLRTQDPSGGWGYQGQIAPGWELVRQTDVRHSLSTAALASLYAICDLAGIRQKGKDRSTEESGLPEVIREVKRGSGDVGDTQLRVDPKLIQMAIGRAKAWQQANYTIDPPRYKYYYLYALERMWTFREYVEGPAPDAPPWYDQGVELLMRTQAPNGSWHHECGVVPDTAFGVLFLVRSMKKSVEKVRSFGEGTLIGGRGLPRNTSDVAVVGGQVVAKMELANLEKLMAALDEENPQELDEWLEALGYLPPEETGRLLSKHSRKLQALAGSSSRQARIAAIRALGRAGDMEAVPTLIFALGDSDPEVVQAARQALRRIARLPEDFGPPDKFTPQQQQEAIQAWKKWFLSIRPDAQFD
ncbi:MAG: HEAT repeat domain-containing protein [Thermoguttaceae bacterium]|nr:HEAT repeat domain-containing protein [Thermoguttaceae bacterium]MDW8078999.1 HEAT repeat domain-containing protein [Thermoguttaceae bacterium]